jgi:tRNA1Val (adenine37-N6)-methyltransferase
MSDSKSFKFKFFEVNQSENVFKIGTDAFVLGAWIACPSEPKTILDIGAGTGVLSLMMAQKYPTANITAIDSNAEAFRLAKLNFSFNEIGANCRAHEQDFYALKGTMKYDLLVSNPPYFVDSSQPEDDVLGLAKHLSSQDLQMFFVQASRILHSKGRLSMIFPNDQRFLEFAEQVKLFPSRILKVYGRPNVLKRLCVEFVFDRCQPILETLTIRDESGKYTEAYKQLTIAFHGVEL